ncbi:zinc ABC transporter substrate-binding protein [Microbacterium sp. 13-71-7]|jgi:zinc/manganese transport system substrate-binding protein|uniref:metal ABC transporter solute-binding protein, Zn/Mn family n=1 Tax=Microbacterium sp. 13-71-7 TaxID=1970399 RepID=UPI000BCBB3D1|nr:zinc ABC transporter substrate-binding protein [Microbacterium sp. 13-71-7]OZB84726.1 MAG: metal ABC transporter substrate-binding protein [Microbacterium sp. 13-71-7]
MTKPLAALALAAASLLALAGCSATPAAGSPTGGSSDRIPVTASTNVWGDVAKQIGGDHVEVTSVIDSLSKDPHEYEVTAADQLTVSRAKLVLENGGGYDAFMGDLVTKAADSVPLVSAVTFAPAWPKGEDGAKTVEGFNEHVWYSTAVVDKVAAKIADELGTIAPDHKSDFEKNLASFEEGLKGLDAKLATIKGAHDGAKIFVTEPVPLYLTEAAGLVNVTPDAFSHAVEEGQDVPPATLLEATRLIDSGDVKVLFANAQTGGAETTRVIDAAKGKGVPVQEVTELVPDGKNYLTWMQDNIETMTRNLDK